jgi:hypothetical protein
MSNLPTWIGWVILAACPLLGPAIAFLVVLPVAVLDRRINGGREIPAVAPFEVGVTGRYTRRLPFRRALVVSEPAIAGSLELLPPM